MKVVIYVPDSTVAVNVTAVTLGEGNRIGLHTLGYDVNDLEKISEEEEG